MCFLFLFKKSFYIFVRGSTCATLTFGIDEETSTYNLKNTVLKTKGFPVADQVLVFAGKQLKDNRKLWTYGIKSKDTLDLFSKAVSDYLLVYPIFSLWFMTDQFFMTFSYHFTW